MRTSEQPARRRWPRAKLGTVAIGLVAAGTMLGGGIAAAGASTAVPLAAGQPELLCVGVYAVNLGVCIGDPVPQRLPVV